MPHVSTLASVRNGYMMRSSQTGTFAFHYSANKAGSWGKMWLAWQYKLRIELCNFIPQNNSLLLQELKHFKVSTPFTPQFHRHARPCLNSWPASRPAAFRRRRCLWVCLSRCCLSVVYSRCLSFCAVAVLCRRRFAAVVIFGGIKNRGNSMSLQWLPHCLDDSMEHDRAPFLRQRC